MKTYNKTLNNQNIDIVVNKFAKQADGSLLISCGETQLLITAVESKRESTYNFFPLTVNYEEKMYAAGKIPGNYGRREARPSEQATLAARMIDRPIRPLFPQGYKNEIQIVCSVLSLEEDHLPEILALNGASLSLLLAENIPFEKACAAVNVGYIDGEFICNPSLEQRQISEINLHMAGTIDEINMVEASALEISEEIMVNALLFGHGQIKNFVQFQNEIIKDLNIKKSDYIPIIDEDYTNFYELLLNNNTDIIKNSLKIISKQERYKALDVLLLDLIQDYNVVEELEAKFKTAFDDIVKIIFRNLILVDDYRVDGRELNELRALSSEIDILKRPHGTALFTRGETQVLSVVTLGVKSDAQTLDGLETIKEKSFLLHYNFPPYSVGETGRMGAPGRREIGHGHLAEMAISKMLPTTEEFPYTVRVSAEVLESNGSSSQATICATSMALMAAGVPIKKPVGGIAMGLISDGENYKVLTDIQGLEDHLGDMDFKVAGTKDGITAIQMDIKVDGISKEILTKSLNQAKVARLEILENMNNCISKAKDELAPSAPKIRTLKIKESMIKMVIGKGGDTINSIIEKTNVKIDIEEDGTVLIYGVDVEMLDLAIDIIKKLTHEFKVDEEYVGTVTRIESFGAFIKFRDFDQDALLHISDLSDKRVESVESILQLNQEIKVIVKEVDKQKRIKVKLVQTPVIVDGE